MCGIKNYQYLIITAFDVLACTLIQTACQSFCDPHTQVQTKISMQTVSRCLLGAAKGFLLKCTTRLWYGLSIQDVKMISRFTPDKVPVAKGKL